MWIQGLRSEIIFDSQLSMIADQLSHKMFGDPITTKTMVKVESVGY